MISRTQLILIRHAEVEARYHRIFGGQIDMELSPRGHEQAAMLAKYLKAKSFDAIYASPMKRVQLTIAPLLAERANKPIILEGLREVNFGVWTGLSWEEVKAKHNVSAFQWLHQLESGSIAEAESGREFRARVEPCVEQILREQAGKTVAIACHGGVMRMILSILLKLPLPDMAGFEIDYAGLTMVHCLAHKN